MSIPSQFSGPNLGYALELYDQYLIDPGGLDAEWQQFFATWSPPSSAPVAAGATAAPPASSNLDKALAAATLARMIREAGHLTATIDPLKQRSIPCEEVEFSHYGLTRGDLEALPSSVVGGPIAQKSPNALVALQKLREAYSGSIGYEDDHVQDAHEREWFRNAIESGTFVGSLGKEEQGKLLELLTRTEEFERYLHTAFTGKKRFSVEGADMLVPIIQEIIQLSAQSNKREVVIGMAHRGRLNVLANVLGKPYSSIISAFEHHNDKVEVALPGARDMPGGDVKYHWGWHRVFTSPTHQDMPVTLAPNPSHLEFVNPIVAGRARAAQEVRNHPGKPKRDPQASVCILVHGDAAFPGQGVVAETLNLGQISGYRVGGAIHIIVNNQIGFTTSAAEARSTTYASDLAKGFEIPIVHVNADDPEACIAAVRMAVAYREEFRKDFLIDLVGYRRFGHNEIDEPAYTQPGMYEIIRNHPTVTQLYRSRLIEAGSVTAEAAEALQAKVKQELVKARAQKDAPANHASEIYHDCPGRIEGRILTSVTLPRLVELNDQLVQFPEGFEPHPKLAKFIKGRSEAFREESPIEWAHAEALAFASVIADGTPVRVTGQDVQRGTFTQRHLVFHDYRTGAKHCPLRHLPAAKATFAIYNSPLSECAVLGFEYGYSIHATETLVLWEAQFGDFVNTAQVILDQFLVSGNAKWGQTPSLVLSLPHGYEGQGPEHSSARIERFLQLAANDNIRVANCTTPGQYFHLLRRQAAVLKTAPAPLIVFSPKSLLRYPGKDDLEAMRRMGGVTLPNDLAFGGFDPVLDDPIARQNPDRVTRLILCSGKVFADLCKSKDLNAVRDHVAIARIEELYPFPFDALGALVDQYVNLKEVIWVQEEPRNMGPWRFVAGRIQAALPAPLAVQYEGRPESPSTSEGSEVQHGIEQNRIVHAALSNVPELKKLAKPRRSSTEDAPRDTRTTTR